MFVRVTSGHFFARLTSARLPIQPEFRFSIEERLRQYLGMIPDDIVARVDKALAISVALEKMKATDV